MSCNIGLCCKCTSSRAKAKLLRRIIVMTAVSKYLFSINWNVLKRKLPHPCQNGESSSPAKNGNFL